MARRLWELDDDSLACVLQRVSVADASRLLATCRAMRATDDGVFGAVAAAWYSPRFWAHAAARPARTRQPSMRAELVRIERFQRHRARHGLAPFTEADFRAYWCAEAAWWRRRLLRIDDVDDAASRVRA
jgi:hypothetical protein